MFAATVKPVPAPAPFTAAQMKCGDLAITTGEGWKEGDIFLRAYTQVFDLSNLSYCWMSHEIDLKNVEVRLLTKDERVTLTVG